MVKWRWKIDHLGHLKAIFNKLCQHQLKINPLKCALGATSSKFLRFAVRYRGIGVEPAKIKGIAELSPPIEIRELRVFQGRIAYICRFISNMSGRSDPFTKLMEKNVPFEWNEDCQKAFDNIKAHFD